MERREKILATCAVAAVALTSILLALQGWGGRITSYDLIPHAMDAALFLATGQVPTHGCLSSLGSYIPPGTSWLIALGQFLFNDPRLEVVPGALLLHGLALWGVFCLARWCGSWRVGLCAAWVFAFSPVSLKMAVDLWPRFPMAATIWFVYFLGKWSFEKRPWCLGAALVVLSVGLYVHIEGALLVVALPLAWILFRPPVSVRAILIAGVIGVAVWLPYLQFEQTRGFSDLKSQLGMKSLFYEKTVLERVEVLAAKEGLPSPGAINVGLPQAKISWRAGLLEKGDLCALGCVRVAKLMGVSFWPYGWLGVISTLAGWLLLATMIDGLFPVWRLKSGFLSLHNDDIGNKKNRSWRRLIAPIGFLIIFGGCLANEWILAHLFSPHDQMGDYTVRSIRLFQGITISIGLVTVFRKSLSKWMLRRAGRPLAPLDVVAALFIVPWLAMAWMSDEDTPYRFWLFWPVVSVILVVAADAWIKRVCQDRILIWRSMVAGLLAVMILNPAVMSHAKGWVDTGWGGDSTEVNALQSLASVIKREGGHDVSIGYLVPFQRFMAYYNVLDNGYKVGWHYDWYLQNAYGIRNTRKTPGGISSTDRYLLVEQKPPSSSQIVNTNMAWQGWVKMGEWGVYSWWNKSELSEAVRAEVK
jgi:hypothetical protein